MVILTAVVVDPPAGSSQQASLLPSQPEAWPQEGSHVDYELRTSSTIPDGSYQRETVARLLLVYDGTAWTGTCSGAGTELVSGAATRSDWSTPSGGRPAFAPSGARLGDQVEVSLLDDAGIADDCWVRGEPVLVTNGSQDEVVGEELEETAAYQDVSIAWDPATGLVLEWTRSMSGGSSAGNLVSTDAFDR